MKVVVGCWGGPNGFEEFGIAVYWGMRNPVGCIVICGMPNGGAEDIWAKGFGAL